MSLFNEEYVIQQIDLIASGYEWICPDCGELNTINVLPSDCVKRSCWYCDTVVIIDPMFVEHTYGKEDEM